MRLAVISDIHGNMEAFQQVLTDIGRSRIDAVICLGDNIGYGPEPEQVIMNIRDREIPSVIGNHELAVSDRNLLNWFNPLARQSLLRTVDLLSQKSLNYISHLKTFLVDHDCRFVHGFPPDSATTYLFQVPDDKLRQVFLQMKERVCFTGHTHNLEIISFDGHALIHSPLGRGETSLYRELSYIVNIGSVGQPRDGNNNAKYVIWDTSKYTIEVRFVPYDIFVTFNKILDAGLPRPHAMKLW